MKKNIRIFLPKFANQFRNKQSCGQNVQTDQFFLLPIAEFQRKLFYFLKQRNYSFLQ